MPAKISNFPENKKQNVSKLNAIQSGDVRKSIDGLRMITLKLLRSGLMHKDDFFYLCGVESFALKLVFLSKLEVHRTLRHTSSFQYFLHE